MDSNAVARQETTAVTAHPVASKLEKEDDDDDEDFLDNYFSFFTFLSLSY